MSMNEKEMSTMDKKKNVYNENVTSTTDKNEHKMENETGMNEK